MAASPIYYGWVVAALVAVSALIVSPAQVYCVGVVLDMMIAEMDLTRLQISSVYATAALLSAPLITLHPLLVARTSRRLLVSLCGAGVCAGLLLLAAAAGEVTLLLAWTLLLAVGPGLLYPLAESVLQDWWQVKRDRVQSGVHALAATLAILLLPALLTAATSCPTCTSDGENCGCWRGAYSALGALLAVPVAILSALLLEGGAADHNLRLDGADTNSLLVAGQRDEAAAHEAAMEAEGAAVAPVEAAAEGGGEAAPAAAPPSTPRRQARRPRRRRTRDKEMWVLGDVLTHSTFWLAQVSISTVQALVAAFLFHRAHIAATHFADAPAASPVPSAPLGEAALGSAHQLPVEMIVGLAAALTCPVNLLLVRKEYLVLLAIGLAASGMLLLAASTTPTSLQFAAALLGAAYGVTNAYATSLWEYLYGSTDAHRIKQISVAIATASSGVAIWLFAYAWHSNASYHSALLGGGLLALALAALDVAALAKPEVLEAVVRRAPTWEQLVAFRQRRGYFSTARRAKQRAAKLAIKAARRARVADPDEGWADVTLEPVHQSNPIELELHEPQEPSSEKQGEAESSA